MTRPFILTGTLICISVISCFAAPADAQQVGEYVVVMQTTSTRIPGSVVDPDVPFGDMLNVLKVEGNWLWVETPKGRGWIQKAHVATLPKAEVEFRERARREPSNDLWWYMLGLVYCRSNQMERALENADYMVQKWPDRNRGYLARVEVRQEAGLDREALSDLKRLTEISPREASYWRLLGECERRLAEYEAAESSFAKALQLAEDDWSILSLLANCQYMLGKQAEAEQSLKGAIELCSDELEIASMRGDLAVILFDRDPELAIETIRHSLGLNSEMASLHARLGWMLMAQEQLGDAVASFNRAIELSDQDSDWRSNRGHCHQKLGQYEKAIDDFRRAIELDGQSSVARGNLGWLLSTSADERLRDGGEALRQAQQAIELAGVNRWAALSAMAAAHAENGEFEQAVKFAREAVDTAPASKVVALVPPLHSFESQEPWRE